MIPRITTALLLTATLVHAQTVLTPHEQYCQGVGVLAHAITVDRDQGVPLTSTLTVLRGELLPALGVSRAAGDALAYAIYADVRQQVSPHAARQAAEWGCLEAAPAAPAPAGRKGRKSEAYFSE